MLSTPSASPAWMVRCAPAPIEHADGRRDAVGREADLGAGQVEADDAVVAVAHHQPGDLVPAVVLAHGAEQRAHPDRGAGLGGLPAADREAVDHRLDDVLDGQPLRGRQLRGEAHLGVDDAVGGQVERALAGHPVDRLGVLHHADGVREGLQVPHQRAGVGRLPEPARRGSRRRRRAARGSRASSASSSTVCGRSPPSRWSCSSTFGRAARWSRRSAGRAPGEATRRPRSCQRKVSDAEHQPDDAPGGEHQGAPGPAPSCRPAPPPRATSGRNTDRSPCAIHLSGKNAATVCIQVGIWLNWKKTPEMNCSTQRDRRDHGRGRPAVLGQARDRDAQQRAGRRAEDASPRRR